MPPTLTSALSQFRLPQSEEAGPGAEPSRNSPPSPTGLIPGLTNIQRVAAVTTYGASRQIVWAAGDGGRGLITRGLLPLFAEHCSVLWLGLYEMDAQSPERRTQFLATVQRAFERF